MPTPDEQLNDNLDRLKARLAVVPPGKTGVFVTAFDWKLGLPVAVRTGAALRIGDDWQIAGDGEFSKLSKRATFYVAWQW